MSYYIDSSALLRIVFKEKTALKEFSSITQAVSSDLLRVECLRTIDRTRIEHHLDEDEYLRRINIFFEFQRAIELIPVSRKIMTRASQPFPTSIASLDAIHLASCLLYQERLGSPITLLSHDKALVRAAQALGIKTLGVENQ